jgi:murein DD-endopeptidase MepM/ murein hydrolase activator NlpD
MMNAIPLDFVPSLRSFGRKLVTVNGLDLSAWILLPGMCFQSNEQWWASGALRKTRHEGIDLLFYRDGEGKIVSLSSGARIPVAAPGEIAAVAKDFLGRSLFVRHKINDGEGRILYTLYGHLCPAREIRKGRLLRGDEILGNLSGETDRYNGPPPHLHFSVAWFPRTLPWQEMIWETLVYRKDVIFVNPQAVLG